MRVCHFTSAHKATDDRIFLKECVSLAENNYEVYIVGIGETGVLSGVNIIGFEPPTGRFERFLQFGKKVYKTAKELDCDIYHFHDPELLYYGLKLKKQGKKVIFDSHEDVSAQILDKYWIPKVMRKFVSALYKCLEAYVVRSLDAVVTATPYIANKISKHNKNTRDVRNYPILDNILILTKNISYFQKENTVCYVGGLTEQRGISDMIEAIDNCPSNLVLAGTIESEYQNSLTKIPGYAKTVFAGYLAPNDVYQIYGRSRVGLCVLHNTHNHYNSLPIKMFEYMAAGLPVVASNFPLWREIIEENNCGICVEPTDVAQITQAINYLLKNPDEAERMGKNGRKAIEEKYNWNSEKVKLFELYKQLEA